jgi:glucuronoarabinoxylan endo-1,4-beta-xylanase
MKHCARNSVVLVSLCLWQILYSAPTSAQTVVVEGTVSTSTTSVRYASVSFSETDRPAIIFTVLTDSTGKYQLRLNITSVEPNTSLPTKFALAQNYPNPFSSATAISYDLKAPLDCRVTIYDILGRVVQLTQAGIQTVGTYSLVWDGSNTSGHKVAPGVYFYRLQAGGESQTRKMVLSGGRNGLSLLQQNLSVPMANTSQLLERPMIGKSYTVRIENSSSTFPSIYSRQIENVVIQSDTTINVMVDSVAIPTTTVYLDSVQQRIRGFGGANIIPWRPAMTADQIQKAFGAAQGELGFSILRLRVPYDTNASELTLNASVARKAQALGAIVFASPWTPPPALKSNNNIVGGTLIEGSYGAFASHLRWFINHMANNGAPLYGISIQNEPDITVTYESCDWNATQILKFMKNNAPSVGTRIIAPESFNFNHALSDPTLNDSLAAANLSIVGGHIYGGGIATYPLAVSKGKELWMTEHLDTLRTWSAVLGTGKEIHDCLGVGWNAYVWWYIVRFYGPIDEDGTVTKRGYVMSHYSRFVRPGYYKVKCNATPQRNVWVSSYKDSSSSKVVIVVLNTGFIALQQTFTIPKGGMISFAQYTTTQSKNCEKGADLSIAGGRFTVTLEPSSIMTFVSN